MKAFSFHLILFCDLLNWQNVFKTFILLRFRIDSLMGATQLVPLDKFSIELGEYKERLKDSKNMFKDGIPIGYTEVNSVFGRCLFVSAEQYEATTEQKYAGKKF